MKTHRLLGILTFLGLCLLLCEAKPYHTASRDEKAFREEPQFPKWSGQSSSQWMSWDPSSRNQIENGDADEKKKDTEDIIIDPCQGVYCHFGRVCQVNHDNQGECVCADKTYCVGHNKQVCGTDGLFYPSHCELHRMACVLDKHIGIDHAGHQCKLPAIEDRDLPCPMPMCTDRCPYGYQTNEQGCMTCICNEVTTPSGPEGELDLQIETVEQQKQVEDSEEDDEEEDDEQEEDEDDIVQVKPVETVMPCTELEYGRLKASLLQYHCARIGENNCSEQSNRLQFLANIMFNYYDVNSNELLDESELSDIEHRDHLEKLSRYCGLTDILTFDDQNEDGNITMPEFFKAFNVPTVVLEDSLKVFSTIVTVSNSIELKCDIKGATNIIWQRNGAALQEDNSPGLKVFDDGSLYVSDLGLQHMGNYTCHDHDNPHVIQTHILKVQMAPTVNVNPATQFHTTGSSVTLKCHADGVPEPRITWEMNEAPLPEDPEHMHYMLLNNNATLEIKTATYTKDTGAYKCKAKNAAGTAQDIATVFIENTNVPQYSAGDDLFEVFVVFHDKGYTIYEPNHCHMEHMVTADFKNFRSMPEYGKTLATLCEADQPCSWGEAVSVQNKYIYITQPRLNRVVVIEIQGRSNPIEVIPTDKMPVSLQYVERTDQVWVLCWNEEKDTASKTIVVLRQASEEVTHHTVHTQPIGNRFDLVKDLFLPPNNDLRATFTAGYVVHNEQQGLYKVDLESMTYTKAIDLKPYKCVPQSVAFIPLGGHILVHCNSPPGEPARSSQLLLDYITDAVTTQEEVTGDSYVSPDGRFMVVVADNGDMVTVNKVTDEGKIEKMFDEYTNLHISDVTFFPSERGRSYDFYATSKSKNDVLYINLASGKVEMIAGVGQPMEAKEWPWSHKNRIIVSGGVFGEFLMTPSKDSVVVIDGRRRHVQCEWRDILHGNVIVWVEPLSL